jgi:plasmid stabilization system protein ParE
MQAQGYILQDDPAAAQRIAQRIADAAKLLLTQPNMGRPGRVEGTREWVVKDTPYLIAYCVESDALQVVGVIHSKQRWPEAFH